MRQPASLIGLLWLGWGLYWLVAARSAKAARRRESLLSRFAFVTTMALIVVLLAARHWPGFLGAQLIGGGWTRYWLSVVLVVAGLAFSIWARVALGRNWSGTVTIKVDHELVQEGPYRRIRHPIYSGILLALLGSALASGRGHGLLAFAIACVAFVLKARVEEAWMTREFGERYAEYRRRTWALLPYVI